MCGFGCALLLLGADAVADAVPGAQKEVLEEVADSHGEDVSLLGRGLLRARLVFFVQEKGAWWETCGRVFHVIKWIQMVHCFDMFTFVCLRQYDFAILLQIPGSSTLVLSSLDAQM